MTTTMTVKEQLENQVNSIADNLTNWSKWQEEYKADREPWNDEDGEPMAYMWLEDALDITYRCNRDKELVGAEVWVCLGGPNIVVEFNDNGYGEVKGYWGSDRAQAYFTDNGYVFQQIDDDWNGGN